MELIVKVTKRCNMACTFCAASNLASDDLTPEEIADAAKKVNAQCIILLGGEPLMMPPAFYEKLLELVPENINLDFTTNLKSFVLHPDAWTKVLSNPRVNICTSFNYGNTRKWDTETVYTEDMFKKAMRLFHEHIGYMPMFISVMDENNIQDWEKHILLAKELGTRCRLNNAIKIGRQTKYFPRAKMFKIWIEIAKRGLAEYEQNTWERGTGKCPLNTCQLCRSTIRLIEKQSGKIVWYDCDDKCNSGMTPLQDADIVPVLKPHNPSPMFNKCYACELFNICNGCEVNVSQIDNKEEHCAAMKSIEKDIINLGWKLR